MTEQTKPPLSYWPMVILGLLWNLMGCANYIMQTSAETVATMPQAYQAIITNRPAWATAAFAIAVFGGAVGCNLLLLRRRVAYYTLLASFAGVAVTMIHALSVVGVGPEGQQVLIGTGMSLVVAAFLLWTSHNARKRGWLR